MRTRPQIQNEIPKTTPPSSNFPPCCDSRSSSMAGACHQCRKRTNQFALQCKACDLRFCNKCFLEKNSQEVEAVAVLERLVCPKCRGVCTCGICTKKRDQESQGKLLQDPEATVSFLVLESQHHEGPELADVEIYADESLDKPLASIKGKVCSKRKRGKEDDAVEPAGADLHQRKDEHFAKKEVKKLIKQVKWAVDSEGGLECSVIKGIDDGKILENLPGKDQEEVTMEDATVDVKEDKDEMTDLNLKKQLSKDEDLEKIKPSLKVCGSTMHETQFSRKSDDKDDLLPPGISLTVIAGVLLPPHDVGAALQFLEFCNAFSKVLHIKEGQAEIVLQGLARKNDKNHSLHRSTVQFHIKLLSLIQKDMGEDSKISAATWLDALIKCINETQCQLKELALECFVKGFSKYDDLDTSGKLRVLNFLCDRTLDTNGFRNWIEEENIKFYEREKEEHAKAPVPRMKKKDLSLKMSTKVAKVMLCLRERSLVSDSEHDHIVSEMEDESKRLQAKMAGPMEIVPKRKQRVDAVRTEPVLLEDNGKAYWRLGGYKSANIMLQAKDRWFVYDDANQKMIDKYITSVLRK